MSYTFDIGDQVAIYRLGDLRGNPATAKIDRVSRVTARLYRLASGRKFSRKTCADGTGSLADRLLPIDDSRVKEALRRQAFTASVRDLVLLVQGLDWTPENEDRIVAAGLALRGRR